MEPTNETKTCKCGCHKAPGIIIILIGLFFLLEALHVISTNINGIIWPVLIILFGIVKLGKGKCTCCAK